MVNKSTNKGGMSPGMKNLLIVLGFFLLTVGATALELVFKAHQQRPLLGNVVALALLNINVLLLVVLLLLFGRQVVKFYVERKESPFGAGFRTKLIASFIVLSLVPAGMLFVVATGLLTGGVKFWFGPKVEGTVRGSLSLVEEYKAEGQQSLLHFSRIIASRMPERAEPDELKALAEDALGEYGLDSVEIYDSGGVALATAASADHPAQPAAGGFVSRALAEKEATSVTLTDEGETLRAATAFDGPAGAPAGAVVTAYRLPPSVTEKMADISRFYSEYWDLRMFKNPLKESYMLLFILFTLVVLFAAMWFGMYLSRSITVPITSLAEATHRISKGDYDFRVDIEATDEVGVLVDSFKTMTRDLRNSRKNLSEANASLMESNALLEQRKRFIETVLENINTGVFTIDRAGKISMINRAAERISGLKEEETVGRGYREIFEFHQLDAIREQLRGVVDGGRASLEKDIQLTVNRRTLNLRLFISSLHDTDGGYLGILVVFDDLTELIRAQRADAWKEVAKRIAHEIKNPLTPIQLSAQRLRKRYLEGSGDYEKIIDECTETIITQVESMKSLVGEFSKFARMPELKTAPTDLHGIIDEAAALYEAAHSDIRITRHYDDGLPELSLDRDQMKRVFVNLFENAVAALEGKGSVTVSTRFAGDARKVRVEVADDGPGVLPEDRDRLFQPYFSKRGEGMGLGLAIVNRIISDHDGHIHVEGNKPKGTRFIIELPVANA